MSVHEIRTELIRLAAELVTGKDSPSYFSEDHAPRRSRAYWLKQLELAEEIGRNRGIRLKAVADKLLALNAHELSARLATLFAAVEHGDQQHRDWLKQAIEDHFAGRPVEHPRGKGTTVPPSDDTGRYHVERVNGQCSADFHVWDGGIGVAKESDAKALQAQLNRSPEPPRVKHYFSGSVAYPCSHCGYDYEQHTGSQRACPYRAAVPPTDGLPHWTCPNCEVRDEFSVRHDTVEDRRPDVTGYPVVPVVKCEACGQEVRAELRGDESRIGLRPAEPPSDTRGSEPSAADMANAGAAKELAGFRDAFAARDRLIEMEQEALRNRNKS